MKESAISSFEVLSLASGDSVAVGASLDRVIEIARDRYYEYGDAQDHAVIGLDRRGSPLQTWNLVDALSGAIERDVRGV